MIQLQRIWGFCIWWPGKETWHDRNQTWSLLLLFVIAEVHRIQHQYSDSWRTNEYCWAASTHPLYATFKALSTLLIFKGLRILGYPEPLVNSFWVSDFNELDFINFFFCAVSSSQNSDYVFKTWATHSLQTVVELNYSKGRATDTIQTIKVSYP